MRSVHVSSCAKIYKYRTIIRSEIIKLNVRRGKFEWVNEIKYLGVVSYAGKKLSANVNVNCRKCLDASFAILQKCEYLSEGIGLLCKLI